MKHILPALGLFLSTAWAQLPWSEPVPRHIEQAALLPNTVLDEKPCDWRAALEAIFRPMVKDCRTAREAVLTTASNMTKATGVYYSTERRHPAMNPMEALNEKKVSCTGQSIMLVCALRAIGIPARAVGVGSWGHIRGNHTWCEAWFDGDWHMIEFNEKDFNTGWVMEYLGMLRPHYPLQRVYAVSPDSVDGFFPAVWNPWAHIAAEDVTERYLAFSRQWYEKKGLPQGCQRLMLDIHPRPDQAVSIHLENADGQEIARTTLPTKRDDMRRMAPLNLPHGGTYFLRLQGSQRQRRVQATTEPVQILRLRAEMEE